MYTILIIEDEPRVASLLMNGLEENGYQTMVAYDGLMGLRLFQTHTFDLVISDIVLPKMDGFELAKEIRKTNPNIPILMLTAVCDEYMQIMSFDGDADDYMTKPFSMIILGKRVAALLKRRVKQEESSIVSFGETTIDFDAYTAFIHGQKIDITAKELELVKMLFEYQGRVLTRKQMVDCLWGIDAPILDRTIDTYIKNIRKKLGIHTITTVKGVGYRLERNM